MDSDLRLEISGTFPTEQAVELLEVARKIRDKALRFAQMKLPLIQQDQKLDDLFHQCHFYTDFKHGLIDSICRTIREFDENAIESYCFDQDANPDCQSGDDVSLDRTINIILVVESKTAGLQAFITSLDRALTQVLKEFPIPDIASYDSLLNIIPVTQQDIEKRRGYAALLSSVYVPALKVWPSS